MKDSGFIDKAGGVFVSFMPGADKKYDSSKKETIYLSVTEMGKILSSPGVFLFYIFDLSVRVDSYTFHSVSM